MSYFINSVNIIFAVFILKYFFFNFYWARDSVITKLSILYAQPFQLLWTGQFNSTSSNSNEVHIHLGKKKTEYIFFLWLSPQWICKAQRYVGVVRFVCVCSGVFFKEEFSMKRGGGGVSQVAIRAMLTVTLRAIRELNTWRLFRRVIPAVMKSTLALCFALLATALAQHQLHQQQNGKYTNIYFIYQNTSCIFFIHKILHVHINIYWILNLLIFLCQFL